MSARPVDAVTRDRRRMRERYRPALRALGTYGRPHLRVLSIGMLGSIGVVLCRLAIPWPLRWALETAQGEPLVQSPLRGLEDPLLVIALGYLAIALVLGGSEYLQRLNLGRFSAQLVHDLRAAAARGVARTADRKPVRMGDVTARVIGDSARLKSDLSGIGVHGSTNGMLFLAVTAIMFAVSIFFGAIFLVSGMLAIGIGVATARMVEPNARRQREKEGEYADALHSRVEQEDPADLNDSSGRKELRTTRLMTRASWLLHGVLGASVGLGLWFGVREVRVGAMAPGELFIFVAYALTVHRRMVQVGRQAARTGKVVASTNRLASLAGTQDTEVAPTPADLTKELRVVDGKISSDRKPARLKRVAIAIAPGARIAVLGPTGSGKSSLLRLLAGRESEFKGQVLWDEVAVEAEAGFLRACVAYLGEKPSFGRRPLWEHLGLPGDCEPNRDQMEMLRRVGAWQVARRISRQLKTRVSSFELSSGEARALSLAQLLLSDDSSVWVLDGVLEGISKKKARQRLAEIFRRAGDRAVVMSMGRAVDLERFDRVLVLRRGRIVFDGPPAEWKHREQVAEPPQLF